MAKPEYQRRFEFVTDDTDHAFHTRLRKHVQLEHARQKKWRRMQELNKTIATRTSLPWTSTAPKAGKGSDETNDKRPSLPWIQRTPSQTSPESAPAVTTSGQAEKDPKEAAKERLERRKRIMAGVTTGTGKMDPFDCLPIKAGRVQYALVEYYTIEFPRFILGTDPKTTFNPFRQFAFPTAMEDAAAFHSLLSTAAHLRAFMTGLSSADMALALSHKGEAIRSINENLSHPTKAASVGNMQAIVGVICLEFFYGSREAAKIHIRGLQRLLQTPVGNKTLKNSRWLEMQLLNIENTWPNDTSIFFDESNLYLRFEEFLCFFGDLKRMSTSVEANIPVSAELPPATFSNAWTAVRHAIDPDSTLHHMLAIPPIHHPGFEASESIGSYSHLISLFFLAATIRDNRNSPWNAELYLNYVQKRVEESGIAKHSVEMLVWILHMDQTRKGALFGKSERVWQVARLMSIANELNFNTRQKIKRMLIQFLVPERGVVNDNPFQHFNPDEFILEVLQGQAAVSLPIQEYD